MWPNRVLNPGPLTYKSGALLRYAAGSIEFEVTLLVQHYSLQQNLVTHLYKDSKVGFFHSIQGSSGLTIVPNFYYHNTFTIRETPIMILLLSKMLYNDAS